MIYGDIRRGYRERVRYREVHARYRGIGHSSVVYMPYMAES